MYSVTITGEGLKPINYEFDGKLENFAQIISQGASVSLKYDGEIEGVLPYAEAKKFLTITQELRAKNALLGEKQTAKWPVHGPTGAIVSE